MEILKIKSKIPEFKINHSMSLIADYYKKVIIKYRSIQIIFC